MRTAARLLLVLQVQACPGRVERRAPGRPSDHSEATTVQISTTSATSGGSQAQRVLATLLQQTSATDGPEKPTGPKGAGGPPSGPPPGPPPGGGAQQFGANTLGSLLGVPESSDGGGPAPPPSEELWAAVSNLDTDDEGKLSSEGPSAGLEANGPDRRGPPPSAAVASRL